VICNDDGEGKEKVRSSGGRLFQRLSLLFVFYLLPKI